jgi:hypothetical protein
MAHITSHPHPGYIVSLSRAECRFLLLLLMFSYLLHARAPSTDHASSSLPDWRRLSSSGYGGGYGSNYGEPSSGWGGSGYGGDSYGYGNGISDLRGGMAQTGALFILVVNAAIGTGNLFVSCCCFIGDWFVLRRLCMRNSCNLHVEPVFAECGRCEDLN